MVSDSPMQRPTAAGVKVSFVGLVGSEDQDAGLFPVSRRDGYLECQVARDRYESLRRP